MSAIAHIIENFPLGMYLVGDSAYIPTERMLTPYSATDEKDVSQDTFNFF